MSMMMATSEPAADRAAGFQAAHSRHIHVEQNQVEAAVARIGIERVFAGARFVNFVALRGERRAQDAADLRLVVDYQDAAGCSFCACFLFGMGRPAQNSEPSPGSPSIHRSPPCVREISRAIYRPRPVPGTRSLPRWRR